MAANGEAIGERAGGLEPASPGETRVRRALLSVSDKQGIVELAGGLSVLPLPLNGLALESARHGARQCSGYLSHWSGYC